MQTEILRSDEREKIVRKLESLRSDEMDKMIMLRVSNVSDLEMKIPFCVVWFERYSKDDISTNPDYTFMFKQNAIEHAMSVWENSAKKVGEELNVMQHANIHPHPPSFTHFECSEVFGANISENKPGPYDEITHVYHHYEKDANEKLTLYYAWKPQLQG